MSTPRFNIITADACGDHVVLCGDGTKFLVMSRSQSLWLLTRLAVALALTSILPMAASRSGCAGDGEGAAAPSPELTA